MIKNYAQFYNETENYLDGKAAVHGVNDLARYYELNQFVPVGIREKTLQKVLYHIAFESQDYTFGNAAIGMGRPANEAVIRSILKDYDHTEILRTYTGAMDIYNELEGQLPALNHKGTNIKRYPRYHFANRIWNACIFLNKYSTYKEFHDDVMSHNATAYDKAVFLSEQIGIPSGIALSCNILKEIDEDFDVAKPDVHIIKLLYGMGEIESDALNLRNQKNAVVAMKRICDRISADLDSRISVYRLDRMLWLICSETFFFDDDVRNTTDAKRIVYIDFLNREGLITA